MPPMRVTFFFKKGIDGWSETYYSTNPNINTVDTEMIVLADLRSAMLSPPAEFIRMRVSDDAKKRDRLIRTPNFVNNTFYSGCDPAFTALRIAYQSGDQYVRSLFLRGIPDSVVVNGEYNPFALGGFAGALTAFHNELRSGRWGVQTKLGNVPVLITEFTAVGGLSLDWNVTTAAAFAPVFGEVVQILDGGILNGANGKWRVSLITDGTHIRVRPIGAREGIVFVPGMKIRRLVSTVQTIDRANIGGITHRDQGRPFGQHRGRRRALARSA